MAAGGPWSVKGIAPQARETAKDAARRQGKTLGEWLNEIILETGDAPAAPRGEDSRAHSGAARPEGVRGHAAGERVAERYSERDDDLPRDELELLARRLESAEHRSTLAITGIDQSVRGLIARLENAERMSGEAADQAGEQVSELHNAQSELERRLAELESDTTAKDGLEAVKSLESAVAKVAGHVHDRDQRAAQRIGGVEENVSALGDRLGKTAEDLSRRVDAASDHAAMQARRATEELRQSIETREAKTSEALANIESTIERINQRLSAAENLTDNAMRSLEGSFAHLDDRLRQAEEKTQELSASGIAERIDQKFETLGRELRDRIEQVRQETAETIDKTAAADRLDKLERSLSKSNRRTARTLSDIGEQIGAMGEAMGRRMSESEDRLRGEFAQDRTVEKRLSEIENASSEAIRQVAQSVEKISERLAERIEAGEQRNAQTVSALGDEMARLAQSLTPAPKTEDDTLAQRLRESERRTQQMIRDAVAGVSAKLDAVRDESESTLSPVQSALANLAGRLEAIENGADESETAPARARSPERAKPAAPAAPAAGRSSLPPAEEALSDFDDGDDDLFEDGSDVSSDSKAEAEPEEEVAIEPPPRPNPFTDAPAAEAMDDDDDDWGSVAVVSAADADWNSPLSHTLSGPAKAEPAGDEDGDEDAAETARTRRVTPEEPAAPPRPLGATADSNFLAAARTAARNTPDQSARAAGRASVLEARGEERSNGGRKVLIAAGILAVLALGGAAALLFMDGLPFRESGVRVAGELNEPGVSEVLNGESGEEFAVIDGAAAPEPAGIETQPLPPAASAEDAAAAQIEEPASAPPPGADLAGDPAQPEATPTAETAEAAPAPEPAAPAPEDQPEPVQTAAAETPPAAPPAQPESPAPVPQARFVSGGPGAGEPQTAEAQPAPAPPPAEIQSPAPPPAPPAQQTGGGLEQAAAAGDPGAQLQLGEFALQSGDPQEGARLIQSAANQGLAPAQYRLGKLYETGGAGVPQDDQLARQWTQRAATAGNRNAMHNLALMFAEGRGAQQSDEQAAEWFERAALLGATDSQFNLAVLYEQGRGVPMSLPDAYAWYRIAERAGDREAGDRADLIADQLPEGAAAEAQRVADAFQPRTPAAEANTVPVR